jgi:adenine-specific DNA-methyltransferase
VLQGPAERVASRISADLCYLDPPYKKRQYAANYHMLETLARGDEPEAIGISGLRDWWDQYSDFCSKLRIRSAFASVFERMDCPMFLISYSEDGLLTRQEMIDLLRTFGVVRVREIEYKRFRSNASSLAPKLTEYLFTLKIR